MCVREPIGRGPPRVAHRSLGFLGEATWPVTGQGLSPKHESCGPPWAASAPAIWATLARWASGTGGIPQHLGAPVLAVSVLFFCDAERRRPGPSHPAPTRAAGPLGPLR